MEDGAERPRPTISFEIGEAVRVVDGPFGIILWRGRRCG